MLKRQPTRAERRDRRRRRKEQRRMVVALAAYRKSGGPVPRAATLAEENHFSRAALRQAVNIYDQRSRS